MLFEGQDLLLRLRSELGFGEDQGWSQVPKNIEVQKYVCVRDKKESCVGVIKNILEDYWSH